MLHHRILYLSRLAPHCGYDVFAAVCRTARRRNAEVHVSGILLFDGFRFCQSLTGPAPAVKSLLASIIKDVRHTDLVLLVNEDVRATDAASHWTSGFVEPDVLDEFDLARGAVASNAWERFAAAVAEADLDGGPPQL